MIRNSKILIVVCFSFIRFASGSEIDFQKDIQPVFTKFCAGCHNPDDLSGDLDLSSFAAMQKGGEHGATVLPGNAGTSRLIQVLDGTVEPSMPPEDEPRPSEREISLLRKWVDSGATGPAGKTLTITRPPTPRISPSLAAKPITSLAFSPDGSMLAIARFQHVELRKTKGQALIGILGGHSGKVNSLSFTSSGNRLVAASGITGLRGEVKVWDVAKFECIKTISGHRDCIFAAVPSPDDKLLATSSYDRSIRLWNLDTGELVRTLEGHNGAVFDLDFAPNGKLLASASADATVKIWDVATGRRLDTLSQPLQEQYSVVISPDGKFVFASGADNRIRKWSLISYDSPQINPIQIARFGHEQSIEKLVLTPDGRFAVSVSADHSLKVWDARQLTEVKAFTNQSDSVQALAISAQTLAVGRMDGSLQIYDLNFNDRDVRSEPANLSSRQKVPSADGLLDDASITDTEPNSQPVNAQLISLPANITGKIHAEDGSDVDLFRFVSKSGQRWIFEVKAARDKSPLDSKIAVLDADGNPVPRVRLQAIRDSYFTFRGKDSSQTGDFRLHNWREMQLNQFLYASGEVVKMYHYPRGPDSGFNVYPNFGKRHTYFNTTAVTHALGESCYIVEPRSIQGSIVPNGLPVFTINYENDDECTRRLGSDSRLQFKTPADGEYLLAIRDVRGFGGENYNYTLTAKPPKPDFHIKITGKDPKVALGAGRRIGFEVERVDEFEGEIQVEIDGLPEGFSATSPIVVQAGHLRAAGAVVAAQHAASPGKEKSNAVRVTARAMIDGTEVVKQLGSLGEIRVAEKAKVTTNLTPEQSSDPTILEVIPGQTVTVNLKVVRNGHDASVSYGNEDAMVNSPHGVYVDNIGLNGVLIPKEQTERKIFITAEPWVKPCERWVFVEASVADQPACPPILMRVVAPSTGNQTASESGTSLRELDHLAERGATLLRPEEL